MIVIPMAGQSRRFFEAGYTRPKYMLPLLGKTLFDWSVLSFRKYFTSEHFVFVVRDIFETPKFVAQSCENLGLNSYEIIILDRETEGQAETVFLGISGTKHRSSTMEHLLIFNIDTIRPGFHFPGKVYDGYIEVFKAEGGHWSFVEPVDNTSFVKRTTEKERISDLCSTGIYGFRDTDLFLHAYYTEKNAVHRLSQELFVAPIYNHLIKEGAQISFYEVPEPSVICSGTPAEYETLLKNPSVLDDI